MLIQKICFTLCFFVGLSSSLLASSFVQYVLAHIDRNPHVVLAYLNNLEQSNNNDILIEVANFYLYDTPLQNIDKANILFKRVADRDDPRGYKGLADSYLSGQGFTTNLVLARIFYEKAARLGYGPGQFNIAILYRDGMGGEQSVRKACEWLKKAYQNKNFLLNENAQQIAQNIGCLDAKS